MGLRADRVMLGKQHPEQDELGGLHVERLGVERTGAQLLGDAQELGIDLAGEFEARRRQRRQRAEHLDVAVAERLEVGRQLLLLRAHCCTLMLASWMILRHFGSSDRTNVISSSGVPAIDWNR